jgi:HD-like signal output (HDOD) protein
VNRFLEENMKKRVLFVDDEPKILTGLKNRMRRYRQKWEMFFVESGGEALAVLDTEKIDVIVADMRMPNMDGAELLSRVQSKHPEVVRVVLSAYAEFGTILRAVPLAHQYLSKPCDVAALENIMDRACKLQQLVNEEVVRQRVGEINTLPSDPQIYFELQRAIADNTSTLEKVIKIVEKDVAMSAKILQIANSEFFKSARHVSNIEGAISYLGIFNLKQLALTVEVFSHDEVNPDVAGFSMERLQQHSLKTALVASKMFDDPQRESDAYIAGLLHDIGVLVLVQKFPREMAAIIEEISSNQRTMCDVEKELFGITHAEIGAYLVGLWGLPYPIVEAVAHHHEPDRVEQTDFDLLSAVHVANILVNNEGNTIALGAKGVERLNIDYLDFLGVKDRLEDWQYMASHFHKRFT